MKSKAQILMEQIDKVFEERGLNVKMNESKKESFFEFKKRKLKIYNHRLISRSVFCGGLAKRDGACYNFLIRPEGWKHGHV